VDLTVYSADTQNCQINVQGWKTYRNDSNYITKYNDEYVYYKFDYTSSSGSLGTSWWELGAEVVPDTLRPANNIFFFVGNLVVANIRPDAPKLRVKSVSGSIPAPFTLSGEVLYRRK
jgi:hypothetical protein